MAFQLPTTTSSTTSTFSFGLNTASATANTSAASTGAAVPAKPAFSFGTPTSAGNDANATKAAPPPFSGFGLGGANTALGGATVPTSSAATAPTSATAPTFGGFMTQSAAPAATTASAPATTANPLGGISLGLTAAASKTTAATTAATASTLGSGASLSTATAPAPGSTFANLSTATKTTDSSAVTNATQLSYNQLEEHINKWTLEFEEQEKVFAEQATQINAWDKLLISNNQKIIELNDSVQKVKMDQQMLDQELEFIATQHKELEESLVPLEKEFTSLPRVDPERSQTYLMVENLDTQLKQMSEDLKEVIDNLNEANKGQDQNDPIIQIGKILNAHMNSLQWIESQSTHICKKLDEIAKIHESQKRDVFRAPF